jgi:hypothetical protein
MADADLERSLAAAQRQNAELQQQVTELQNRSPEGEEDKRPLLAPTPPTPPSSNPVMDALVAAKPRYWMSELGTDMRTPGEVSRGIYPPRPFFPPPTITRQVASSPDPVEVTQKDTVAGSSLSNISFLLTDASTTAAGPPPVITYKVKVFDGKINGTFPSGMGGGNYILTVPTVDTYYIIAGVTFNPSTLAENSWFLDIKLAADVPESRVEDATHGFLYWQVGFVYFTGAGPTQVMHIWITRLGDINFALTYGNYNAKPALLPVDSAPGWIDLDGIFA